MIGHGFDKNVYKASDIGDVLIELWCFKSKHLKGQLWTRASNIFVYYCPAPPPQDDEKVKNSKIQTYSPAPRAGWRKIQKFKNSKIQTYSQAPRAGWRKSQKFKNLTMFSSSKGRTTKKSKIQKSKLIHQLQGQDDEKFKNSKIQTYSPAPRAGQRKSQKFKNPNIFTSFNGRMTKKSKIPKIQ